MKVFEAIEARRSVRNYLPKPVEPWKLRRLLEAARLSPSARNLQPWELVVVTDAKLRRRLVLACFLQRFVGEAPVFIAGVIDPKNKWAPTDLAIALQQLALEAVELGLGTCWIGAFSERLVKRLLGIPKDRRVFVCMTVGYPAKVPKPKPKKPLERLAYLNKYGASLTFKEATDSPK
jgi:nitroreductase